MEEAWRALALTESGEEDFPALGDTLMQCLACLLDRPGWLDVASLNSLCKAPAHVAIMPVLATLLPNGGSAYLSDHAEQLEGIASSVVTNCLTSSLPAPERAPAALAPLARASSGQRATSQELGLETSDPVGKRRQQAYQALRDAAAIGNVDISRSDGDPLCLAHVQMGPHHHQRTDSHIPASQPIPPSLTHHHPHVSSSPHGPLLNQDLVQTIRAVLAECGVVRHVPDPSQHAPESAGAPRRRLSPADPMPEGRLRQTIAQMEAASKSAGAILARTLPCAFIDQPVEEGDGDTEPAGFAKSDYGHPDHKHAAQGEDYSGQRLDRKGCYSRRRELMGIDPLRSAADVKYAAGSTLASSELIAMGEKISKSGVKYQTPTELKCTRYLEARLQHWHGIYRARMAAGGNTAAAHWRLLTAIYIILRYQLLACYIHVLRGRAGLYSWEHTWQFLCLII